MVLESMLEIAVSSYHTHVLEYKGDYLQFSENITKIFFVFQLYTGMKPDNLHTAQPENIVQQIEHRNRYKYSL